MIAERDCPKCGYGIMEKVSKVDIVGVMTEDAGPVMEQKQIDVWRCIDCLAELEIGDGAKNGRK